MKLLPSLTVATTLVSTFGEIINIFSHHKLEMEKLNFNRERIHLQYELELQRMKNQFIEDMKRLNYLIDSYNQSMENYQYLIHSLEKSYEHVHTENHKLLNIITQCNNPQQQKIFIDLYMATYEQLQNLSLERRELAKMIHDAGIQHRLTLLAEKPTKIIDVN